jgi:hypothetical protein
MLLKRHHHQHRSNLICSGAQMLQRTSRTQTHTHTFPMCTYIHTYIHTHTHTHTQIHRSTFFCSGAQMLQRNSMRGKRPATRQPCVCRKGIRSGLRLLRCSRYMTKRLAICKCVCVCVCVRVRMCVEGGGGVYCHVTFRVNERNITYKM